MPQSHNNPREVFSIDEEWNQEVPGVTRLIKAQDTLQSIGVVFEHHFKIQGNKFIYLKTIGYSGTLQPWQKMVLRQLELDGKSIRAQNAFHEFSNTVIAINEVFAADRPSFIQVICSPSHHENLIVLQSQASLLEQKEKVLGLIAMAPTKEIHLEAEVKLTASN